MCELHMPSTAFEWYHRLSADVFAVVQPVLEGTHADTFLHWKRVTSE